MIEPNLIRQDSRAPSQGGETKLNFVHLITRLRIVLNQTDNVLGNDPMRVCTRQKQMQISKILDLEPFSDVWFDKAFLFS